MGQKELAILERIFGVLSDSRALKEEPAIPAILCGVKVSHELLKPNRICVFDNNVSFVYGTFLLQSLLSPLCTPGMTELSTKKVIVTDRSCL